MLNNPNIITESRVLKAMAKAGHIKYPVDKGHKYVDCSDKIDIFGFEFRGVKYVIQYLDGCIYPFVAKHKAS